MFATARERRSRRRDGSDRSVVGIELKDGGQGCSRRITADLVNRSEWGLGVSLVTPLKPCLNTLILVKLAGDHSTEPRPATVVWCHEGSPGAFRAGLKFVDAKASARNSGQAAPADPLELDFYELMQLSPNADSETIERVYRILAQRYHPDNAQTGSVERFIQLSEAYRTLSDPELRAGYDAVRRQAKRSPGNSFQSAQDSIGLEAEKRKRQGILQLLHARTLQDPEQAALGVLEMEDRLGCPREHLNAALWYLRGKGYIQRGDNGRCMITVEGVDAVEESGMVPRGEVLQLTGVRARGEKTPANEDRHQPAA